MQSPTCLSWLGMLPRGKILMDQQASSSNGGQVPSSHVEQHTHTQKKAT